MRIAEFVELEQFGRERFAARVSLTLVLVDAYFSFPGIQAFPLVARNFAARITFPISLL